MGERFGNFAEGMSWGEINDELGEVFALIERIEQEMDALRFTYEAGLMTKETFDSAYEALDQQLAIAKYNRDAYKSRLDL